MFRWFKRVWSLLGFRPQTVYTAGFSAKLNKSTVSSRLAPHNIVVASFERNVNKHDVVGGKLCKIATDCIRKRKGRRVRVLEFPMTAEGAKALHAALGATLEEYDRQQVSQQVTDEMMNAMWAMISARQIKQASS